MIQIESTLEGRRFNLHKLEQLLKPKGYVIGGNWDYDRGFFDYKMADDGGYQYLRIPFTAVEGQLDSRGVIVSMGTPFVISHVYQKGLDDHADSSNMSAAFNQFSEPQDPDGTIDEQYVQMGKELIQEIESLLAF
ncbi:YugN-like family protein [Lederbergia citrea]|uniref:YugN-like family protein n=1 Tax=Lederbergia citrea TaxID=2833581 RepID=A0A942UJZ1_9BACI|nr:YugN-like family protein [Lederbergia citrea]MBS4178590.1 YugN-like family protein [Lederbergia citrea]MBS4205278.1 YugN-like family protein [Lederbergia citrea]MBS4222861.1 YugN-like family protein [Lederbergia citrea]